MGVAELHRLKQLEKENTHLKRLVADLSLDKHMLTCRNFCTSGDRTTA
jgi:putative transposase